MAISLECNARTYYGTYEQKVREEKQKQLPRHNNAQTVEENYLEAADSQAEVQAAPNDTEQQSGPRSLGPGGPP